MNKIIALFPGQGSQTVGMGKLLHDNSELAKRYFTLADEVLGFPLSTYCFEGPIETLTKTAIAQPAILTVSTICFELFREHAIDSGKYSVVAAAGHSLGEYSALVASGALRFEDAVLLVHKRGTYMQEAVPVGAGKMAAVLGRELAEIETVLATITDGIVQVANVNSPGQIVIAGDSRAIDAAVAALGGKVVELPVSAPFHCALMKPAEDRLAGDLHTSTFKTSSFPVYANYSAQPVSEPDQIRTALRLQVCGRVRWVESLERVLGDFESRTTVEFGAGNVLSGLMKRIDKSVARMNVDSQENLEDLLKI